MKKKHAYRKYASSSILVTALAVAIAIVANLLINSLPTTLTRYDVTANDLFTFSQETLDRLDGVQQDVTLYLLAETGYEDAAIVELLERYKAESPYIHVEYKDPVLYPYFASQYTNLTLDTNSVLAVSDLRTTAINYADFYPEYYDEEYNIISEFDGESCLTSAIIYVSTEQLPVLYTTTGHGEYALPDTLITSLAQECFSVAELDLLTVDAVPEDASALVIHGPQTDFTEDETAIITEYLAAGGRLMVMTDVVTQRLANLEVLMGTYGVYAEQGIIVEGDSDHHLSSYQHYLFPDMAASEITDPISEAGYRVMVPLVHPLYVKADLRDGLRVIPLLTSSDSAYLKADAYNASTMEYVDGDKQGCFTLALQIEEDDMRILWFGTSMITDEVADSLVSGTNTDLLLNSFNWLSEQDSGLTIRPRSLNSGYLTLSSLEANTWQTVTAIVLPVVILTVGLTVWAIRRRR